ncbi:MAG: rhodanese-like domain-containing protein [Methylococcaceae bacterium]|jgi:rhodanese-related sulfurtransferase
MDRFLEFILNHYILSLALAVVTYLLIYELIESSFKKFNNISPLLAVTKMNQADVVVIDIREPSEFVDGHIEGAINAPLSNLPDQLASLESYKNVPVLIACQTGMRSSSAGKILTKAGFEQVSVIAGGMQAWETDYKLPIKKALKKKS